MITIANQGMTFVGTSGGEFALTNPGVTFFQSVTYVQGGTNAQVDCSQLRDGSRVTVDAGGLVSISESPDLVAAFLAGGVLALGTVGLLLALRAIYRWACRCGGIPTVE